jgi:hypothetical protein
MSDDVAAGLQEIAELLRQRVEQTAEISRRSEERMAQIRIPIPVPEPIDFAAIEAKQDQVAAQRHADAQAFRERLLVTLERQNELLSRLVQRVERGSSTPDTG